MSLTAIHRRLDQIERQQGMSGAMEQMSDTQLWRIIRRAYPVLVREHGSLPAAVRHLRATGDACLASLIEEDTGATGTVRH
ncbi:hypothetical protein FF100_04065 [Methylobacterium terricola]|uniref:Uncharacterized protein n=1 Tax=Methylobacterium terricola TaxID=2583531 RepID=A0A5C4LNW2_9HYPH|nr:hypothetical protein [Methylobacterium terricola]TNC16429.1 hypothetical protein FF100_04065 [Methylobacterium terricola]